MKKLSFEGTTHSWQQLYIKHYFYKLIRLYSHNTSDRATFNFIYTRIG